MPVRTPYRCNNCGHRFEIDVLTVDEQRDAQRRNRPVFPIGCPQCQRRDIRKGWE